MVTITGYFIFQFIFAVIVSEAITNILTKSELFIPVRKFLFERKDKVFFSFFSNIIECGYCTSVWIGFFMALMYWYGTLINPFFIGLFIHRLSNFVHHIIDRIWGQEHI